MSLATFAIMGMLQTSSIRLVWTKIEELTASSARLNQG